jgi:hypothetical protein
MALSLRDVQRDMIASRALNALMDDHTVAEEKSRLVLTKTAGDMRGVSLSRRQPDQIVTATRFATDEVSPACGL